jgi:hypothetical protein
MKENGLHMIINPRNSNVLDDNFVLKRLPKSLSLVKQSVLKHQETPQYKSRFLLSFEEKRTLY